MLNDALREHRHVSYSAPLLRLNATQDVFQLFDRQREDRGRVGNVLLRQGETSRAMGAYRQCHTTIVRLLQRDPHQDQWQRDLSVSHERMGDLLLRQGNFAGALAAYEASLAIRAELAEKQPRHAGWQRDLACALGKLAAFSCREAYAEKLRAALTRRDPAVRDCYDVDHAFRTGRVQPKDRRLIGLVRRKLAIPGNEPIDVSKERLQDLRKQVDAQLKPVLRERDFTDFDIDHALETVNQGHPM